MELISKSTIEVKILGWQTLVRSPHFRKYYFKQALFLSSVYSIIKLSTPRFIVLVFFSLSRVKTPSIKWLCCQPLHILKYRDAWLQAGAERVCWVSECISMKIKQRKFSLYILVFLFFLGVCDGYWLFSKNNGEKVLVYTVTQGSHRRLWQSKSINVKSEMRT